jgi:hypothetical protein
MALILKNEKDNSPLAAIRERKMVKIARAAGTAIGLELGDLTFN